MTLPAKLYRRLAKRAYMYGTTCPELVVCLLDIMEGDAVFDETFAPKVSSNPVQSTRTFFQITKLMYLIKKCPSKNVN